MRSVLCILVVAACAATAHADVLWGKAEKGASLEEIARLYPEGSSVIPTDKQKLDNGATLQYSVGNIDIVKKPFVASFYFLDGSLNSVGLKHDSKDQTYVCENTFDRVQEALLSKYGKEIKSSRKGGLGLSKSASWVNGKTSISLNMFSFGSPDCTIFISYSSRLSDDSANL